MSKTIVNIKNIVRIIIGVLVIISMLKSCAKALSMNALNNMLEDMKNNKPGNYYKGTIYNVIKQTSIQNRIAQYIGDYDNIILYYNPSGPTIEVRMYNSPNRIDVDSNYRLNTYFSGTSFSAQYRANNVVVTEDPNNVNQSFYARAYIDGNNNNQNYFAFTGITVGAISNVGSVRSQFLGWTNYIDNPLSYGNLHSTKATYENQEVQVVQTLYSYSQTPIENFLGYEEEQEITFTLTNTKTNQIQENTFIWNENAYIGRNSNKSFYATDLRDYIDIGIDTRLINFNTIYNLKAKQGEHEIETKIVFLPLGTTIENGTITSIPSGDYSYNIQDSTNDIINNQEENNSFWENAYNEMFVMESGEQIRHVLESTLQELNLPSGEVEMAMARTRYYKFKPK